MSSKAIEASWAVASTVRVSWRSVRPHLPALLGLLVILGLSVGLLFLPVDYSALGSYGYLGVFFVTLLATASIVLPVPYLGVIVVAGSFLHPALVGLVAGLAAALGEFTGYFLGRSGRSLLSDNRWYRLLERAMARYGAPVIFVAAVIPNPFFDAVGLVAGATGLGAWRFVLPCFAGKALRFWALAALGDSLPFL